MKTVTMLDFRRNSASILKRLAGANRCSLPTAESLRPTWSLLALP